MPKPPDLTECPHCKWRYPDEILNPVMFSGSSTPRICGICALAFTNQFHGVHLKKFKGEMAEEFRQDAIDWRHNHRECRPSAA